MPKKYYEDMVAWNYYKQKIMETNDEKATDVQKSSKKCGWILDCSYVKKRRSFKMKQK